jgi:flagellar biosynthetic protein FlhB
MADVETEDRTEGASRPRLQQARERGQVAHSPELTSAAGLLAATALLGVWGDDLAGVLIALVREPLMGRPIVAADPADVVAWVRHLARAVAPPLGAIVVGAAVAALAAHQVQVRGLWVPGLLAPDPARLWAFGRGPGLAARGRRGAWSLVKAAVVVALAFASIRDQTPRRQRLGGLEPRALAAASGTLLRQFTFTLATATLALGLLDLLLQHRRHAAMLRMSPAEHREDQRSMEGDPALRARRRRVARTMRSDPSEVLTGASLVLTGASGLTLIVGGGPPPRRASIRSIAQGTSGFRLRHAAGRSRIPEVADPALARRLAGRRAPALPLPPEDVAALAALWPEGEGDARPSSR